jgi:predicted nuclease with TOPRIM domain
MGPKKKTVSSLSASDNNSAGNMERLQEEMNEKLSDLVKEVRSLATKLKKSKSENESLKQKVQHQADQISELRNNMNDRESHARSWSICAINILVPKEQESDNNIIMKAVYEELVVPILEGAKACGDIATIPARENIIEIAHILPGKAANV